MVYKHKGTFNCFKIDIYSIPESKTVSVNTTLNICSKQSILAWDSFIWGETLTSGVRRLVPSLRSKRSKRTLNLAVVK